MNNKILVTLFTLFMFPVFQNLCALDSNTEISHNDIQSSANDSYDKQETFEKAIVDIVKISVKNCLGTGETSESKTICFRIPTCGICIFPVNRYKNLEYKVAVRKLVNEMIDLFISSNYEPYFLCYGSTNAIDTIFPSWKIIYEWFKGFNPSGRNGDPYDEDNLESHEKYQIRIGIISKKCAELIEKYKLDELDIQKFRELLDDLNIKQGKVIQ